MTIKLSSRVQAVKPSPTLAITARAAALRAEGKTSEDYFDPLYINHGQD